MRKFEFSNPNKEVEIAGEVYTIDLSDDKVIEYQQFARKAASSVGKTAEIDLETATEEEVKASHAEAKNFCIDYFELVTGPGSFDKFYEKSGKSLIEMSELMNFLTEVIGEKAAEVKEQQKSKYLAKKG